MRCGRRTARGGGGGGGGGGMKGRRPRGVRSLPDRCARRRGGVVEAEYGFEEREVPGGVGRVLGGPNWPGAGRVGRVRTGRTVVGKADRRGGPGDGESVEGGG